jgi:hypothetical protein
MRACFVPAYECLASNLKLLSLMKRWLSYIRNAVLERLLWFDARRILVTGTLGRCKTNNDSIVDSGEDDCV